MAKSKIPVETTFFNLGDRVRVRTGTQWEGTIIELRGALGPKGCHIYRVSFEADPDDFLVEVRGDQLELLAPGHFGE